MNIQWLIVLIVFAGATPFASLAQKKSSKKNPYAEYWEQQEKQEQFDKIEKEAHQLFQQKKYQEAKSKYEAALKIIPDDQRAIAKVRDINLLLEKQAAAVETQIKHEEIPDTLTLFMNDTVPEPRIDTVPKSLIQFNEPKQEKTVIKSPDSVSIAPVAEKPKPVKQKPEQPKVVPKKPNEQPFKNSDNYRKYLATLYEPGWTEEEYEEGKKQITKRVFIHGVYGEEYLKVKHHYGAIFYFKNGESISQATWIAETEKLTD